VSQDFVRRLPQASFARPGPDGQGAGLHLDIPLVLLLMVLSAYGLLILYIAVGANPGPVTAQAVRVGIGFAVMIVIAQISPVVFLRSAPWLFVAGLALLLAVSVVGTDVNGSRRWLRIPGIASFQPSELMKLVVPLLIAWYLHDRHLPPKGKHIFWALALIFVPVILIYRQPDLGTSLLIAASGLLVVFLAGVGWRYLIGAGGLALLASPALWFLLREYQRERILTMFNPERDPLGAGWNTIQAKTAIGSGGLFGKGLFEGTQSQLDFLPESQTDFIMAVLAEELGLVGVVGLLLLYILITGRGAIIAVQAQDTFGRLLAGSVTFTFFVYVFVNIGMVSGVLPVVGVPLPLVSYGGTSIVTLFAGFGILMSIHTHRRITL
jgi:rod shape determining protein RodA